jgi:hypothetical protein
MGGFLDVLSGGKRSEARALDERAVEQLNGLQLPSMDAMRLELDRLVEVGQLTPNQAEAIMQERSAYQTIQEDPRLREAQMSALMGLQDVANQEGMTAGDRAKLEQAKLDAGAYERGQRESILQNARQRGVGGSGVELLSQMQAQQEGANRVAQEGFNTAALAQQRALEAMTQSGQLGGQIRGQEFNQQAQAAEAADKINSFNTQQRQNVLNQNVDRVNQAAQMNLANKQNISNQNVDLANKQKSFNSALVQQQFDNAYKKAGGTAGAMQNQAAGLTGQAAQDLGFIGGVVSTGGALVGKQMDQNAAGQVAAAGAASDRRVKEDIKPFDVGDFLGELTGYRYNYKEPERDGEGPQIGVMAQDLEKAAPGAVEEDEQGVKRIDYGKLGGLMLASLAELNKEVQDLKNKS